MIYAINGSTILGMVAGLTFKSSPNCAPEQQPLSRSWTDLMRNG